MLKVAYSEIYTHPLPHNHRFPMSKYELLPEQLLYEGTLEQFNFFEPSQLDEKRILAVHTAEYWSKLKNHNLSKKEIRKTGFPFSQQLIDRETHIMQGTLMCADYALVNGVSMNIAGGTHHAFTDRGEGFCLLNDIAIAAQYLLDEGKVEQILVVDLDVHQGNGTAQIFENQPNVFTFSMHGAKNYPAKKEQSDLDISLEDGAGDDLYLTTLEKVLTDLVEKVKPDFIFYQSGVDILETDRLGRLSISMNGCKNRDRLVLSKASTYEIPLVASMGGGYSEDLNVIIEAHANTFRLAQEIYF